MQVPFKNFDRVGNIPTWRQLVFFDLLPFLKTRIASAFFIQEGNLDKIIYSHLLNEYSKKILTFIILTTFFEI